MLEPTTPESNGSSTEQPLSIQLAKKTQTMISNLKELLNDPSAPGIAVFGNENNQIAILLGKVSTEETSIPEQDRQNGNTKGKHLIISPEGFFLAEGSSNISSEQNSLLKAALSITEQNRQAPMVSIDAKELKLKISTSSFDTQSFKIERVDSAPEEFVKMLMLAIESSRKIAQEPLLSSIANAQAGNAMLDGMLDGMRRGTTPQPPSPTVP